MSYLLIKINIGGGYQDGDVISAFEDAHTFTATEFKSHLVLSVPQLTTQETEDYIGKNVDWEALVSPSSVSDIQDPTVSVAERFVS